MLPRLKFFFSVYHIFKPNAIHLSDLRFRIVIVLKFVRSREKRLLFAYIFTILKKEPNAWIVMRYRTEGEHL